MKTKKITIELTLIEYAKVKAYCAANNSSPKFELLIAVENPNPFDNDDKDDTMKEVYNDTFKSIIQKEGYSLKPEFEQKYLK